MPTCGRRIRHGPCRAVIALALVALAGCGEGEVSKAERIERARAYHGAGELRAAMIELKNAAREDLTDPEIRRLLGRVYLEMDDPAPAAKELQRAIDLGDDDPDLRVALGRAWLMMYEAERLLDALPAPPADADPVRAADILLLRGRAFVQLGMEDDAAASFEAALAADPNEVAAQAALGDLALRRGEMDAAAERLARAEAIAPDDPEVLRLAGELAYLRSNFAGSEAAYRRLVELGVTDGPVAPRIGLARALIYLGRADEAASILDGVMAGAPYDTAAQFHRALAAFRMGDHVTAARLAEGVASRIPGYMPPYLLAGAAHYARREPAKAIYYLERFVAAHPSHWPARDLLDATRRQLEEGAHVMAATAADGDGAAGLRRQPQGAEGGGGLTSAERDLLARAFNFTP